ncbi:MAG: phospho-N-acetylmuramoyl-pentapeptide-transferase [Oscillospiraceae bacterium]|nr:phospho-N-acetylmuramoyl-pentapeptide-transferase [Oscillospiraceae bacterium]
MELEMDIKTLTILAAAAAAAFILAALGGRWVIPALRRLKFGQTIRDIGPVWHKKKQGIPTMGGVLFIGGTVIVFAGAIAICELVLNIKVFGATQLTLTRLFGGIIMALCCGALGFADDYIKVVKKRNLGLTARQKLFGQMLVALGYSLSLYMAGGTSLYVPFMGEINFGIWFIPFCIFVVLCMTNAVNLTDGVDGLCGTVSFTATLFFIVAAGLGHFFGMGLLAASFAGSLAGFLVWNINPARVFMGDTGSLFIGGILTAFAFGINQPFLLVPVGIIYIAEMLSVVLQVLYFKATHGKRLFKMSPLHHHFEMSGMSENRIVVNFTLVTLVGGIVSMIIILYA